MVGMPPPLTNEPPDNYSEWDKTGQDWRKSEGGKQWEEKQKKKEKLFEQDRIENPHLALISDHLWWLALLAKISLGMLVLSIIGTILLAF